VREQGLNKFEQSLKLESILVPSHIWLSSRNNPLQTSRALIWQAIYLGRDPRRSKVSSTHEGFLSEYSGQNTTETWGAMALPQFPTLIPEALWTG